MSEGDNETSDDLSWMAPDARVRWLLMVEVDTENWSRAKVTGGPGSGPVTVPVPAQREALLQALAQDPSGVSVGLTAPGLPPGCVAEIPGAGPLYWVSDDVPTAAEMARARAGAAVTGLWPLLVAGDRTISVLEPGPDGPRGRTGYWLGEGQPSDPAGIDAERWMAERWTQLVADNEANDYYQADERVSALAPAGTAWPGPYPQGAWDGHADDYADSMTEYLLANGWIEQPRMVLVPAVSGSDALVASRCMLAAIDDVAGYVAVLRTWEQRVGAQVIALRHDTLFVSVAAAPVDRARAAHIACEHFTFAPDNVQQNADSFAEYVDRLVGEHLWAFWWD